MVEGKPVKIQDLKVEIESKPNSTVYPDGYIITVNLKVKDTVISTSSTEIYIDKDLI